jgi:hypothetical protein
MLSKNLNLEFLRKAPDSFKKWARHPSISIIWAFYLNLRSYFFRPESYSQFGEDLEIRKWLPENQGFYIEIGSGYPISGSNSFYFYRLGWKGVVIDPFLKNIVLNSFLREKQTVKTHIKNNVKNTQKLIEKWPRKTAMKNAQKQH